MATAVSLPRRAPLIAPRPCNSRRLRLVHVSAARGGVRSLTVSATAGARASSGLAPDAAGTPAWDTLGGVSVLAAGTGDAVALTDLWDPTEGVAVVALLRHFGCFCCWELASVLKDSMPRFDSAGARLIAIGVGTPDKARILADGLPFPVDSLYADPERKVYNVLGLYHGLGRTLFSPASVSIVTGALQRALLLLLSSGSSLDPIHGQLMTWFTLHSDSVKAKIYSRLDSIKKATKNYTLKGTPTDLTGVLQQGGMFVFRGKELVYSWRDEGTGDHAPMDDVLSACCSVPAA